MRANVYFTGNAPYRGTAEAAGSDLTVTEDVAMEPGKVYRVGTGTSVALPEGSVGLLTVRSSMARRGVAMANGVGIIDSDYRGEVSAYLTVLGDMPRTLHAGERILQLVVLPYARPDWHEVDTLDPTERGTGGFGSTGL